MVLTGFGLRLFLGQEIDERLGSRAFFRLKCSIMQKKLRVRCGIRESIA